MTYLLKDCENCGTPLVKRKEGVFIYSHCPKCCLKEG